MKKIYAKNKMISEITFIGIVESETELYITINREQLFKSDYIIEILCNTLYIR